MTSMAPQLSVPVSPSLALLAAKLQEKQAEISRWFAAEWLKTPPSVYGSVDLRHAGFKIAPVDMNLFPAGFNNLNPEFLADAVLAAKVTLQQLVPHAKSIALIPENHTRNFFYWENVSVLVELLSQAGFVVRIGSISEDIIKPTEIILKSGKHLLLEPVLNEKNKIHIGDCIPDMILLNNDLSAGIPLRLQNVVQPLFPPAALGWHQRLKSQHFQFYADLSHEFASLLGIDSWLITPLFRHCGEIDFLHRAGFDRLIEHTESLLVDIQRKYHEYGVNNRPFVMIKADAGTQGMAVMNIHNSDELRLLNRKQRTSMAKSKGGLPVHQVIVQEGVYSFEKLGEAVAEPVVYLWGQFVAGGFYRYHEKRGRDENLNSPGMQFHSLPYAWGNQKHLYIYSVIAQLSMLAAARELIPLYGEKQS